MLTRRATPSDASAIVTVLSECWSKAYRGFVPDSHLDALDLGEWAARIRRSLESGAEVTLLGEQHGSAIALVTYGPCRDDDLDPHETGEVWGLYVAPANWRRGLGTLLLREGESALRSNRYAEAVAWVFEENARGRRFYEASGYSPDGATRTLVLGGPVTAVRYRKVLPCLEQAHPDSAPREVSSAVK